jgi:hypothetical protein
MSNRNFVRNFVGDFLWTMQKVVKFRLIFFSRLIKFQPSSSSDTGFFLTSVADSTFVLFDLVRSFIGLFLARVFFFYLGCRFYICLVWSRPFVGLCFFTTGKIWGYIWAIPKSGQHSIFCHIARILRPYPHPPHESNSVHAYILEAVIFFWAAQTYLVAALLCIVFRP